MYKMKTRNSICLLIITFFLPSCSIFTEKSGTAMVFRQEPVNDSEAIIYAVRKGESKASSRVIRVKIDDILTGKLKKNTYLFKKVNPGIHELTVIGEGWELARVKIELKSHKAFLIVVDGSGYVSGYFDHDKMLKGLERYRLDFGN
jgi:hypothetical protein